MYILLVSSSDLWAFAHFDCKGMYTRFHTESEGKSSMSTGQGKIWRRLYDGPLTDPFNK